MTVDHARRGGWRWRALRRAAVLRVAAEYLDDPHALAELRDPRAGALTPPASPWFAIRTDAVRRCALEALADPLADSQDRHTTRRARIAIADPHEDAADSAVHGPGGVDDDQVLDVLVAVESALAASGVDTSDIRRTIDWTDRGDAPVT